jgi:OOP family OmpA-OmpF porin
MLRRHSGENMKVYVIPGALALATLATLISPITVAQDAGWYVGVNAGQARAKLDETRIVNGLLEDGFVTTEFTNDERHFSYKGFVGYEFNKYLALEGGYFDLGNFDFSARTQPPGRLTGNIELDGFNIDAVLSLPFTQKFSLFGRLGVNRAKASDTFTGTGAVNVLDPRRDERENNVKLGAGLQYDFTPSFGMRIEGERYRVSDAVGNRGDIDVATLGLLFRFGRHAPVADAPAAAVAIPPPPALVIVPEPARTEQYCSILDFQFEINRDEIQLEEKEKLAVVGTFLAKYPDTTAVIEGHTDNVGTPENNMQLSKRRAESVVSYLLETFPITASRLTSVGYGDTRPIGDNATEDGKRMNRRIGAIVACATDIEGLTVRPARMTMAMLIEFDHNKADIRPQDYDELRKLAKFLKANPTVTATVEGHTGNLQATPELAQQTSQQRAQNVVNYLVNSEGIDRSRLSAQGYGQTRRFAYNTTAEGRQENRRVNVIINYPK